MPLVGLQHTLVLTDDLERTKAFYCDTLGFEVGERPELPFPGSWLYLDGVACLHVAERGSYEAHAARMGLQAKTSPLDHVAFEAEEYDQLLERLEAAGIEVTTNAVPGSGVRQLFFDDPNGARIELVVRG
jgi:catechol 2,3-dioxygenase-like lactoylglutathione lyase family enzyme